MIWSRYIWTASLQQLEGKDATETLDQLSAIGKTFKVSFIISMSLDKEEVPEAYQDKIICAL